MSTSRSRRQPIQDLDPSWEDAIGKKPPCCRLCRLHDRAELPLKGGHRKVCPYANMKCGCESICIKYYADEVLRKDSASRKRKVSIINISETEDVLIIGSQAADFTDARTARMGQIRSQVNQAVRLVKQELRLDGYEEEEVDSSSLQQPAQHHLTLLVQNQWEGANDVQVPKKRRLDDAVVQPRGGTTMAQCAIQLGQIPFSPATPYQQKQSTSIQSTMNNINYNYSSSYSNNVTNINSNDYNHQGIEFSRLASQVQTCTTASSSSSVSAVMPEPYYNSFQRYNEANVNHQFPVQSRGGATMAQYALPNTPMLSSSLYQAQSTSYNTNNSNNTYPAISLPNHSMNSSNSYNNVNIDNNTINQQNQGNLPCVASTSYNYNDNSIINHNTTNTFNNIQEFARPATPIQRNTPAIPNLPCVASTSYNHNGNSIINHINHNNDTINTFSNIQEFARPATPIQRNTPAIPAAPVLPVLDYDPFENFDEGLFEMDMIHNYRIR